MGEALDSHEIAAVENMLATGASWLVIALMLTMDRIALVGRPAFPAPGQSQSFSVYREVVEALAKHYGPETIMWHRPQTIGQVNPA